MTMEIRDDNFSKIDQIMSEADLARQVRLEELQSILRDGSENFSDLSDEDKQELADFASQEIEEINKEYPYTHRRVLVSGLVEMGHYDEKNEEDSMGPRVLSREEMVDMGFRAEWSRDSRTHNPEVFHLFLDQKATKYSAIQKLSRRATQYFAVAPFGSVHIDAGRTKSQRIEFLNDLAPDLINELDEIVLNAESSVDALMSLDRQRVSMDHAYSPAIEDLTLYARELIGIEKLPLLSMDLYGVHTMKSENGELNHVAFDRNESGGGGMSAIGRIKSLYLGQRCSWVENKIQISTELCWGALIDIQATDSNNERYLGKVIGVSLADVDAEEARPGFKL